MEKLSFEKVKDLFENDDIWIRKEFIEKYDFQDQFSDYYKDFIINLKFESYDELYISDLIDLATYLSLNGELLINKFYSTLAGKSHYLVKLSVLDYFLEIFDQIDNFDFNYYEQQLLKVFNTRNYNIVKNEVLLNIIALKKSPECEYINILFMRLGKTNKYQSLIRTVNELIDHHEKFNFVNKEFYKKVLNSITANEYSSSVAVSGSIKKFREFFDL